MVAAAAVTVALASPHPGASAKTTRCAPEYTAEAGVVSISGARSATCDERIRVRCEKDGQAVFDYSAASPAAVRTRELGLRCEDITGLTIKGYGGDDTLSIFRAAPIKGPLLADRGTATLDGGAGSDHLLGGDSNDVLLGGPGSDRLRGGEYNDVLNGGTGDDSGNGGEGDDTLAGGAGDDDLNGWESDDTIFGGAGDDRLDGWESDDAIYGGAGDDRLDGGESDDTLDGGPGNDRLDGGPSYDQCEGGSGRDRIKGC